MKYSQKDELLGKEVQFTRFCLISLVLHVFVSSHDRTLFLSLFVSNKVRSFSEKSSVQDSEIAMK